MVKAIFKRIQITTTAIVRDKTPTYLNTKYLCFKYKMLCFKLHIVYKMLTQTASDRAFSMAIFYSAIFLSQGIKYIQRQNSYIALQTKIDSIGVICHRRKELHERVLSYIFCPGFLLFNLFLS